MARAARARVQTKGSGVAVRTASKCGTNKIRITLTKNATQQATIAYFIFTP